MKQLFLILIALCGSLCLYAQDLITKTNGEDINAKIIEVNQNEIKYKKYDYQDGPTFVLSKSEVLMVRYEDGTKDIFTSVSQQSETTGRGTVKSPSSQNNEKKSITIKYQGDVNVGFLVTNKLGLRYSDDEYTSSWESIKKAGFSRPFITTVHGISISKYAFVGVGLGFQYVYGKIPTDEGDNLFVYDYYDEDVPDKWKVSIIPIYANLKGYLPVGNDFTPYVTISLGGNVCAGSALNGTYSEWRDETYDVKMGGGFYSEYGLGFHYKALDFSIGFSQQFLKINYVYDDDDWNESFKLRANSFFFKVGVTF